ncbi:uncharacterized protein LOC114462562 [Gouania willdenowi]|uniref:Uncharacterized LOC114462562 n=1 Tax=Gouania willdenowi TaxID=441366 RepID=A0A8C5D8D6_GOUWI|nr:uncharacterized protein LOC114462562 [Gouania willdenowi]
MARNEEKQQGRLNRLWLQKERDEGRLKDVHERRPKLASLTTASSVKKWIPSIKKDIEYYLQQSQLSHYPERKIAEFELQINSLESEYKRFITKLRVLDPSCQHTPWTPRAYCKRRADTDDSARPGHSLKLKNPRPSSFHDGINQWGDSGHECSVAERRLSSAQAVASLHPDSDTTGSVCGVQDQPLSFNRTRLAVATAAFRGPSFLPAASQTQHLAKLLQAGLPNLSTTPTSRKAANSPVETERHAEGQKAAALQESGGGTEERTAHVLGLDCYSSSDDDCDL